MNQLYREIGISKQAVYRYAARQATFDSNMQQLTLEAEELREAHPGCGVEKMYYTLKPDFIGRDRFIDTFMQLGYRLKKIKNYHRTTYAGKIYYPNLIKGMVVDSPGQVWQSDLTYIQVGDRFYYAVFIIDVYSKQIVGYKVSDHMRATANVEALKMALKHHKPPDIHHSDRGSQYTYKGYLDLLKAHGCKVSMSLIAPENAYAERINGTIKNEYIKHWKPTSFQQLNQQVKRAVNSYNHKRPHDSLNKLNPIEFEAYWATLEKGNRPLTKIYNEELNYN